MADRPNILLVFTDQQRHDTFTGNVHFDCRTPGMDHLARIGQKFTHAFCAAPQCSPSRATMMTGLYPTQAGMPGNLGAPSEPLSTDVRTIGHRLSEAGYECVYFGKWHLGNHPRDYGFTIGAEDFDDAAVARDAYHWLRNRNRGRNRGKPYLCVVSFVDPHDIYRLESGREQDHGTPPWASEGELLAGKPWPQGEFAYNDNKLGDHNAGRWRYYRDFYARRIEKVDADIQPLIRDGRRHDTWVVFTSDHGDMAGEHNIPFKGPFMYDGVVRVPLVIVPPAAEGIAPAEHDLMTSNIDLVPTLLDMAGVEGDPQLPGRSLLPEIRGQAMDDPEFVLSEWIQKQQWLSPCRMIRTRQWKYVHYIGYPNELYDLESDPDEIVNLAGQARHEAIEKQLHGYLERHCEETGDPYFSLKPTDRTGKPFATLKS